MGLLVSIIVGTLRCLTGHAAFVVFGISPSAVLTMVSLFEKFVTLAFIIRRVPLLKATVLTILLREDPLSRGIFGL